MRHYSPEVLASVQDLLQIGIDLTAERDYNRLFDKILSAARDVTSADAGTLYLVDGDCLRFRIVQNDSLQIYQGGGGEEIDLPPVPLSEDNAAAYAAIHKEIVNVADVYTSQRFDFTGPKRYDALTGYRTQSMLVLPLEHREGGVIGVLQLLNALDSSGRVTAFPDYLELVASSLASQAGIALSNMQYIEEIDRLFDSFVEVMTAAIDARSPYNVNHTRNVVRFSEGLARYLNTLHEAGEYPFYFDANRLEQLVVAAWLHDIGKIGVPSKVMDKPTRLGNLYEGVVARFQLARALARLRQMEGGEGSGDGQQDEAAIEKALSLIWECNDPSCFIDAGRQQRLAEIYNWRFHDLDGQWQPYLTREEYECLTIRRGTLTPAERKVMENHVVMTRVMLDKMHFPAHLREVPFWAALHHELLDGSGYPEGLTAEQIPLEVRIMTIADIYDALTARDRPYKKPMPAESALRILEEMAGEGKLDRELVSHFRASNVWEL